MIALIEKVNEHYIARFQRHLNHSVDEVWSYLTHNQKLSQWFSELRVKELQKGGYIEFDMGDGSFEKMEILDYKENSKLEYTWGNDVVRFELSPEEEGCQLVMIESIKTITEHTPRDLAGWHVCLDVIEALLNGNTIVREEEWAHWYEKYKAEMDRLQNY
jgi:uncharacterized protein YndB with AHSA1/START domain